MTPSMIKLPKVGDYIKIYNPHKAISHREGIVHKILDEVTYTFGPKSPYSHTTQLRFITDVYTKEEHPEYFL